MTPFVAFLEASLMLVLLMTHRCLSQDCDGYDQRYDLLDRLEVFTGRYQGVQLVSDPTTDAKLVSLSDSSKIVFQPATVFPSACGGFPTDFCFRVIFKLRERVQKAFYVLTLTNRRSSVVVLGISLQTDRVVLEYQAKGSMKTREVSFQVNTDQLADGAWHRLQICATDVQAKLNLDCSLPGLSQPLTQRAEVDLTGSGFVGRKTGLGGKRRQSSFQGTIGELEIVRYSSHLEGSFCNSSATPTSTLAATTQASPIKLDNSGHGADVGRMPVKFSELTQVCDSNQKGTFWYDMNRSSMKVCDGSAWKCVGECQCKMDYIELNQTLPTTNASDTELFEIPGNGLFICVTQYIAVKRGVADFTIIFHLSNGIWSEYQRLETKGAQDCKHFIADGHHHLAVANLGSESSNKAVHSEVYRWDSNTGLFKQFVSLPPGKTRECEFFCISPTDCFLAVAKYSNGTTILTESVIYQYHQGTFHQHQEIPTQGGYDVKYFEVNGKHFLAVANAFNGKTTHVNSNIYKWDERSKRFLHHQAVPTVGATDWEFFQVNGNSYLAVANSFNHRPNSPVDEKQHEVDSVIYKFDTNSGLFVVFQSLTTYSASKWLYFEVCGDSYLAVANSYDEDREHDVRSNIYRFQGVEKFVQVHSIPTRGAVDWDHIRVGGQDFLSCANSRAGESHILVLKKTSCCA